MINDYISIETGEGSDIMNLIVRIGEIKNTFFPNSELTNNTELVIPLDEEQLGYLLMDITANLELYKENHV